VAQAGSNAAGLGDGGISKMKPSVTVLIPTFNRAQFLPECLDSVLGQTIPPVQVMVINDGSKDHTREAVAPYVDRIEYIEKKNGGKASALNLGLPLARGDYIWVMDDDDAALPDALETHLNVLEKDPEIGLTWTTGYYAKGGPDGGRLEIIKRWPLPEVEDDAFFLRLLEGNVIAFHSAILCRRSCYEKVGFFNPELIRSQDFDMTLRLARRFRACRIDKPTILYRIHSGARGSESTRFAADDIGSKWRVYNRKILLRLRSDLELFEYLPAELQGKPLGPMEVRQAYLKRMASMASAGLVAEMIEDLQLALSGQGPDLPLTSTERDMVRRTIEHLEQSELHSLRRAIRTKMFGTTRLGQEIKAEMACALYRRAVRGARRRHPREVVAVLRAGRRVHGMWGFFQAMRMAMREEKLARAVKDTPLAGASPD
jgi:glycosyltransferase involved in cell wall biosynthesis